MPVYDPVAAAAWQAAQVSTLSVANCAGRIGIGLAADAAKARLRAPRAVCLAPVAVLFAAALGAILQVDAIAGLWRGSALLGFSYGALFGLLPTVCLEWFGLGTSASRACFFYYNVNLI